MAQAPGTPQPSSPPVSDSTSPPDLLAARAGANRPSGFFELPGVRKFMRNKPAVFGLGIILIYFITAIAIAVPPGLLSMDSVTERVGPSTLRGFGIHAPVNERVRAANRIVNDVESALRSSNPTLALESLNYAERRLSVTEPQQVRELLEVINDRFADYDDAFDEREDAIDDLIDLNDEAGPQGPDPAEREALQQIVDDLMVNTMAALEQLEVAIEDLMPVPTNFAYKARVLLGTDGQGRSIFLRAIFSIKTAVQIGFITALLAVVIGGLMGAAAGFFGGWIDHCVVWLYSTVSAIPYLIWLIVIAFVVRESEWVVPIVDKPIAQTLIPVYLAFVLTFWVGPCRVVRGEAMKIKGLDYIQSARSIGASSWRILLRHVIPNTAYLLFINMSLLFIGAIKAEVILSFLGLGVQGQPSWGIMIRDAKDEVITGFFWQIGTATIFMFVLVLAFNIVSDALQDAFDPKHVG